MSLIYTKFVVSVNTTALAVIAATTRIPSATSSSSPATTTATPTTPVPVAAVTLTDSMRKEAMDVVVAKIICLLILTILSVLCGLLPLRLLIHTPHLFTRGRNSVDYFLCGLRLFSGGIYLATCFLHLMPDTRVKMDSVMKNMGSMTTYAVPELLVMSGFYVVVFMEQIIKTLYVKAQQSDVNKTLRKQRRSKPETEAKRPVQVFRSTLDEDVNPDEPPADRKACSDEDDDDDDDDDNVLIDDEDDLSFDDSDTDHNSQDSSSRVRENLINKENEHGTEKYEAQKNATNLHTASSNSHHNHTSGFNLQQQQLTTRHSKPVSEQDEQIFKTFGQHPIIDTLPKVAIVNCRPYQPSGVTTIHTQVQQRSPLPSHNHHQLHNHIQKKEEPPQQQQPHHGPSTGPRASSPPLPPAPQIYQQQPDWQKGLVNQQQPANRATRMCQESKQHWPAITSHELVGDENDVSQERPRPQPSCHVTVCVERSRGSEAESFTARQSTAEQDKDVDSGVFSTRRDCEIAELESDDRPSRPASRENSFDRISESSSVLQDIQVKRVVDELSRSDDSSRAHFRSILYIMALSFHGIFEGMALGLQSMKSSVWALCFAIVVHRCVLAFKLGMDLCRGEEKQGTAFLCIGMFTLISTLGIIIGIVISSGASLYSNVSVPEAILQSLATGTIFYIVFFDILFKDLEGKDDLKRVSSSFVGFSLMAIVFAITKS